jgi:hypothetical protein
MHVSMRPDHYAPRKSLKEEETVRTFLARANCPNIEAALREVFDVLRNAPQ